MLLSMLSGAFFCVNMVLITLSSFLSATIINLYMRADKKNKVPDWLRMVRASSGLRILYFASELSMSLVFLL